MARGESGRIVIEVEPEVKRRLYAALALSGSTLKHWFLKNALAYCRILSDQGSQKEVKSSSRQMRSTKSKGATL